MLGVLLVYDREVRIEASGRAEAAEQPVCRGVEGASVDLARGVAGQSGGAFQHFAGGAAGEGQEQDPFRPGASLDQVGYPQHQGTCFPGAGSGDYKERAVAERRCCQLFRVSA